MRPSLCSSWSSSTNRADEASSRPVKGSSSRSTSGPCRSARASVSRCLLPRERTPAGRSKTLRRSKASASSSIRASGSATPNKFAWNRRFARPVRSAYSRLSCETQPNIRRSPGPAFRRSMPASFTRPAVGRARPAPSRSNVVLPAPFAPISATKEPAGMLRSSPRRTWLRPKVLVISRNSRSLRTGI